MKKKKNRWSLSILGATLIILWLFLCSYVFLSCKLVAVGYKLEKAKKKHEELTMLNKNYKAQLLMFSSPENLLQTARMAGIELVSPSEWCYVDIKKVDSEGVQVNDTAEAGTQ